MGILILVKQHFCIELAHRYMEGCTTGLSLCHKSFRAEFDTWQDILCASNGTEYILSSISKYIISMANIIHGSISLYMLPNWLTTSYDDGLTHDWFKAVINGCICNIAHCTLTLFSSFFCNMICQVRYILQFLVHLLKWTIGLQIDVILYQFSLHLLQDGSVALNFFFYDSHCIQNKALSYQMFDLHYHGLFHNGICKFNIVNRKLYVMNTTPIIFAKSMWNNEFQI